VWGSRGLIQGAAGLLRRNVRFPVLFGNGGYGEFFVLYEQSACYGFYKCCIRAFILCFVFVVVYCLLSNGITVKPSDFGFGYPIPDERSRF